MGDLNELKIKKTKAVKKMKESERRCMVDNISDCDCERLRGDFTALRSTYQERRGFAYDDYRIGIEEEIKTLRVFFRYVDLKKKRVGYPSVMNFESHSGTGSQEICDLFAWFMK
jgi:hypothetical protein